MDGVNKNGKPSTSGFAFAMAKRRAIRQTMQPIRIKHGLEHSPTIKHTQNGTNTKPPKFGVGGGYKAAGF